MGRYKPTDWESEGNRYIYVSREKQRKIETDRYIASKKEREIEKSS